MSLVVTLERPEFVTPAALAQDTGARLSVARMASGLSPNRVLGEPHGLVLKSVMRDDAPAQGRMVAHGDVLRPRDPTVRDNKTLPQVSMQATNLDLLHVHVVPQAPARFAQRDFFTGSASLAEHAEIVKRDCLQ